MIHKTVFHLIGAIVFFGVQGQSIPTWVSQRPIDNNYYIGIAQANKGKSNYLERARSLALEDLTSQIQVKVSSTTYLSQFETNKNFKEDYRSYVITRSNQEILEYENVATFDDTENYWIYIRILKEDFKKKREEKKKLVIASARDNYQRGLKQKKNNQFPEAARSMAKAHEALIEFGDPIPENTDDGRTIILQNEIFNELNEILSAISFTNSENSQVVNVDRINKDTYATTFQFTPGGTFPVEFTIWGSENAYRVNVGEREASSNFPDRPICQERLMTDNNGFLSLKPFNMCKFQSRQYFHLVLDLNGLANTSMPRQILKTLQIPAVRIAYEVKYKAVVVKDDNNSDEYDKIFARNSDAVTWLSVSFLSRSRTAINSPFNFIDPKSLRNGTILGEVPDYTLVGFVEVLDQAFYYHYRLFDNGQNLVKKGKIFFKLQLKGKKADSGDLREDANQHGFTEIISALMSIVYPGK